MSLAFSVKTELFTKSRWIPKG